MFEIDKKIIEATTKCGTGLACLNQSSHELCEIEYSVAETVHFVRCLCDKSCPYQEFFGKKIFCACPIRKEIYRKYGT